MQVFLFQSRDAMRPCFYLHAYNVHNMHTRIQKKTSRGSEENFCLPGCTKPILVFNVNLESLGGGGSDPLDPRITCMPLLKRNDKQYTNVPKVF